MTTGTVCPPEYHCAGGDNDKIAVTTAASDSKHIISLTVTLPYRKAEFDIGKQAWYKAAIAIAAGTSAANVDILSVTERLRRGGMIVVETKIRATDALSATAMAFNLGSGDALKLKINAALESQGLKEVTNVVYTSHQSKQSSSSGGDGENSMTKSSESGVFFMIPVGMTTVCITAGVVIVLLLAVFCCIWRCRRATSKTVQVNPSHQWDISAPDHESGVETPPLRVKEAEELAASLQTGLTLVQTERDKYFGQLRAVERLVNEFEALPNAPAPSLDALRRALYPWASDAIIKHCRLQQGWG